MPRTINHYDSSRSSWRLTCTGCNDVQYVTSWAPDAVPVDDAATDPIRFRWHARSGFLTRCRSCEQQARRERRVGAARRERVPGTTGGWMGARRRSGIELECFVPRHIDRYQIQQALEAAGLATGRHGGWFAKGDGSLVGHEPRGMIGVEVVSPPLGEDAEQQIRIACRVLRELGAVVTHACGTHIHHDANDLSVGAIQRTARSWFNSQPMINGLVAPSRRRGNTYCQPLVLAEVDRIANVRTLEGMRRVSVARYRTLNLEAYGKHGTLEIRQHQGTLNAEKIVSWLRLGQAIIDTAKSGTVLTQQSRMREWLGSLGEALDDTARTYLLGRAVEFGAVTV